ncbi:hypothetical protein HDU99_001994, partial [Rhizoclosmatium hyalinum]
MAANLDQGVAAIKIETSETAENVTGAVPSTGGLRRMSSGVATHRYSISAAEVKAKTKIILH